MAAFDYSGMQSESSKLLSDFKQGEIILIKSGLQTPAVNEWDIPTENAPTEYILNAVASGVSEKYVNGDTIKATDLQITASVFEVIPSVGDIVKVDDKPMTILQVLPIPAAGVTCAWVLFAR